MMGVIFPLLSITIAIVIIISHYSRHKHVANKNYLVEEISIGLCIDLVLGSGILI